MGIRTSFSPVGTLGHNRLPAGYTAVEYLESTGTLWIDTGVVPDDSTGVKELSRKMLSYEDYVSSGTRGGGSMRFYGYCSSTPPEACYGRGVYVHTGYMLPSWDAYCEYAHNYFNDRLITANGHILASNIVEIGGITLNIVLFGYSTGTTQNVTKCRSRIKYLKLTQGLNLVRDFIPALDPSGRPCMFDLVTRRPFYNQGTGEFLWGSQG